MGEAARQTANRTSFAPDFRRRKTDRRAFDQDRRKVRQQGGDDGLTWAEWTYLRMRRASGSACLSFPMPFQGSARRRDNRWGRLRTVYWLADLRVFSSSQAIGTETGAPGRARVE